MAELAQIGVTDENLKCLDLLKESGYFDEKQEAARFAASLALKKKLFSGRNMNSVGSNFKTQWNTSLVDDEGFFREIIKNFGLCPEDCGVGLRSLIHLGLEYIYERIKDEPTILLGELFDE